MTEEQMHVTTSIKAPVEAVFDVLADPTTHAAIDGTGWVREPHDDKRLSETGQVFRMAMYHDNHPDKDYEMANRVEVFDPPHAIAWQPGQGPDDPKIEYGGWIWRYDLKPAGPLKPRSRCPTTGPRCLRTCANSSNSRHSTSSTWTRR